MTIGGFASLTMLTKNSFLDELNKPYVLTARAKGLTENQAHSLGTRGLVGKEAPARRAGGGF